MSSDHPLIEQAELFAQDVVWRSAEIEAARCIPPDLSAVQEASAVVDVMYTLAGGTAVYDSSPLQKHFRDVHVATQHMMVSTGTLETVGRLLLGLDAGTIGFD